MVFWNIPYKFFHYFIFTGHNPYFNRWFSAIYDAIRKNNSKSSHNPYFNRWFSAINKEVNFTVERETSQSLF